MSSLLSSLFFLLLRPSSLSVFDRIYIFIHFFFSFFRLLPSFSLTFLLRFSNIPSWVPLYLRVYLFLCCCFFVYLFVCFVTCYEFIICCFVFVYLHFKYCCCFVFVYLHLKYCCCFVFVCLFVNYGLLLFSCLLSL